MLLESVATRYLFSKSNETKVCISDEPTKRNKKGAYHVLMPQLKKDDTKFRQYFGMNLRTFKEILNFVKDDTSKRDFYSKKSISAEERLVITVRYV